MTDVETMLVATIVLMVKMDRQRWPDADMRTLVKENVSLFEEVRLAVCGDNPKGLDPSPFVQTWRDRL